MPNYKVTLEYDGRHFAGWQRQADAAGATVQGVLEEALSRLCAAPVVVHGSGRTDAGVHARGQVASFFSPRARRAEEIIKGGNCLLPPGAAILAAEEAPDDFHARFSALGKAYEYDFLLSPTRRPLLEGLAFPVGPGLDWQEVQAALPHLVGEHDFAAFQSTGSQVSQTVRRIHLAALSRPREHLIRLTVCGSGFLRHQVRAIAGTLAEIGRGRFKAASLKEIIASKNRAMAGPTAPPGGLCLARVFYNEEEMKSFIRENQSDL